MIQLIDLMILMVGMYIVTRMMIHILRDDPHSYKLGVFVNKVLAAGTIVVAIIVMFLAITSFVDTLDINILK